MKSLILDPQALKFGVMVVLQSFSYLNEYAPEHSVRKRCQENLTHLTSPVGPLPECTASLPPYCVPWRLFLRRAYLVP